MLTEEELRESPLFDGITYDSYLAMYTCFRAVSKSYRSGDVIYDFSSSQNAVGIVERGEAALIRIDADGVETVMEQFRVGGEQTGKQPRAEHNRQCEQEGIRHHDHRSPLDGGDTAGTVAGAVVVAEDGLYPAGEALKRNRQHLHDALHDGDLEVFLKK